MSGEVSLLKRQVAQLAASGQTGAEIAAELGVTPGYVSQLQEDASYQQFYSELTAATRLATHSVHSQIDTNYDKMELALTDAMLGNFDKLVLGMVSNPMQLVKLMTSLNQAKRRASGEQLQSQGQTKGQVILELPQFMVSAARQVVEVSHNAKQEIIEVDGRPLVAMPSANLKAMTKLQQIPTKVLEPAPTVALDMDLSFDLPELLTIPETTYIKEERTALQPAG